MPRGADMRANELLILPILCLLLALPTAAQEAPEPEMKAAPEIEEKTSLTFAFNGGPSSASVWVHLGAFGPKKAELDDEGMPLGPPPGRLVNFRHSAGRNVRLWNYHEDRPQQNYGTNTCANYTEHLREAMRLNPYLQVLVMSGYFDMATPYFASDYTVSHMQFDPALRDDIQIAY